MIIRVTHDNRVAIMYGDRGPYRVFDEHADFIGNVYTEIGNQVYDSSMEEDTLTGQKVRSDAFSQGYDEGHAEGKIEERRAARNRKTTPDWLKIVTQYLADQCIDDELLNRLAAAGLAEKPKAAVS